MHDVTHISHVNVVNVYYCRGKWSQVLNVKLGICFGQLYLPYPAPNLLYHVRREAVL